MSKKLLSKNSKLKAMWLLDMLYTPSELASELDITTRDVYKRLVPAGLPCTRDKEGHLMIHGHDVVKWVQELRKGKITLGENQAYCVKCRKVVEMVNPTKVKVRRSVRITATCPDCGKVINRGGGNDRTSKL
jgi:hypothetical protein